MRLPSSRASVYSSCLSTTKRKITSSCRPPWKQTKQGKDSWCACWKKECESSYQFFTKAASDWYQSSWYLKTSSDGEILKNCLFACSGGGWGGFWDWSWKARRTRRFGCIVGQVRRGEEISVQPERMEEEEKSLPLPSMGIPGRANHDSRTWSHAGVVSRAVQKFWGPSAGDPQGSSRAPSGKGFMPSTLLCGWRSLLKECFKTTFDQTQKLVQ